MPDWIIWVAVAIALSLACRKGACSRGWYGHRLGGGARRSDRLAGGGPMTLEEPDELALGSPGWRGGWTGGTGGRDRHAVAAARSGRPPAAADGKAAARAGARQTPEPPLQRLQRQFVEGAITMEEYEAGLDELDPRHL